MALTNDETPGARQARDARGAEARRSRNPAEEAGDAQRFGEEARVAAAEARRSAEVTRRRRESFIVLLAGLAVAAFGIWGTGGPESRQGGGNVFSFLLINLNVVLLLLMAFFVVRNLLRLVLERRRGTMGSHLRSRLVLAFVVIALFPATVMVIVSYEFVSNGIDDWLGREVEESLDDAYSLARIYYRSTAEQAVAHANALAADIASRDLLAPSALPALKQRIADEQRIHGLATVEVLDPTGASLVRMFRGAETVGERSPSDAEMVDSVRHGQSPTRVDTEGATDVIRGAASVPSRDGKIAAIVIVDTTVAESPRAWSSQILNSFREFRRLTLSKQPFKNLYLVTLLLASFVVVFSATWLGLYLARGVTEPIGRLAEATRDVASGRLDVALPEEGGDEVATLVRGFNTMIAQLARGREALDERRAYIENVLANIGAGVVSIGADGRVGTINPAALAMLGLREEAVIGRVAETVFEEARIPEVVSLLRDVRAGQREAGSGVNFRRDEDRTLVVTATNLRRGNTVSGTVLFFEDVSQIQQVQRMEAWHEVARRIAHEIKNPLTPIQLSAQRLERRLSGRLSGGEADVVRESVSTIVAEVDGLKRLVNEFSQFARMGGGDKAPQDLNPIVEEALPLYRQSHPDIPVQFHAADSLPPARLDRDAVRRALTNLVENAIAAVRAMPDEPRRIDVSTRFDPTLSRVILEVADTGAGISREVRARIFEPYFSTKPEGTGLGLAIVASMAADHHAYLRVRANDPRGTRFVIEFPATHAQHRA
ncbi:MAG TPA: ATP-binding protein [Candidatus Binatia bacterium]|jgi:two-component system nitrogen regulation sensor histidine kinase NtrY